MKMKGQFLSCFALLPLASADTVKVTDIGYTTVSSGKTVQAKRIISLTNGSERIVSDNVPFGFCQEDNVFLYDFGWESAKRRISRVMASHAIHLTNFLFPGITLGKAPSGIKDFMRKKLQEVMK